MWWSVSVADGPSIALDTFLLLPCATMAQIQDFYHLGFTHFTGGMQAVLQSLPSEFSKSSAYNTMYKEVKVHVIVIYKFTFSNKNGMIIYRCHINGFCCDSVVV